MIHYKIGYENPQQHFVNFEVKFPTHGAATLELQLAAWRPGRYELGNFAKSIRAWAAFDEKGNTLDFKKITKDRWQVSCPSHAAVVIKYDFYAAKFDAGSSWLSEEMLYLNPVNCFLYNPAQPTEAFTLKFDLPKSYSIATGMEHKGEHELVASDFQQLLDCPLIASDSLQFKIYNHDGVEYKIWMQGNTHFDQDLLTTQFEKFTKAQVAAFGDIPCSEYHFLFLFPEFRNRHGVEHENSTVITMGPAKTLEDQKQYEELLGISCHELYHTWNIKNIRPEEMMPYDFTKENYSRLGYVCEGVTTYFGDQFLLRSGVFDLNQYFSHFGNYFQAHFDNPARFNLSVADSSFDTWLDGYERGVPGRKTSIYTEGCLTAFLTDVAILECTDLKYSLDDVMRNMYINFGKKKIGYTEKDYRNAVSHVAGHDLPQIFDDLIYGTQDYLPQLQSALDFLGLAIEFKAYEAHWWSAGGFKANAAGEILAILPSGAAAAGGLWLGDKIEKIDGKNYAEVYRSPVLNNVEYAFSILRDGIAHEVNFTTNEKLGYQKVSLLKQNEASEAQQKAFEFWQNRANKS